MSYDISGPVKVNETKSLLLLILLVALVAAGIWIALAVNKPPPPAPKPIANAALPDIDTPVNPKSNGPAQPVDRPRQRQRFRPDRSPDGLFKQGGNSTLLKVGGVYITLYTNNMAGMKIVGAFRSRPRDEQGEAWAFAEVIQRIANEPRSAEKYEAPADQVAALKAIKIKTPQLSNAQQKILTDLFKTVEAAKPEDRPAAEKALTQAAAGMTISADEQKTFDGSIAKALAILTAGQIEMILNDL